jgi:hypothetical protein
MPGEEKRSLPGSGSPELRAEMESLARRNRRPLAAEIGLACELYVWMNRKGEDD